MCTIRVNVTACKFDLTEVVQKRQFSLSEMSDSRRVRRYQASREVIALHCPSEERKVLTGSYDPQSCPTGVRRTQVQTQGFLSQTQNLSSFLQDRSPTPLPSFFPLTLLTLGSTQPITQQPSKPSCPGRPSSRVLTLPCSSRKEKVPFPVVGGKFASVRPCDSSGRTKGRREFEQGKNSP